ncbi:MAG TPA: hypothetical protein VHV51_21440, partial [Polyangiaceae bacterium]|nr:hypothetical protein [Polyangiaceae bacterium]
STAESRRRRQSLKLESAWWELDPAFQSGWAFLALRRSQRLATRASSNATGACPVSSREVAHLSRTVISRANLAALYYFPRIRLPG